MECLVDPRYLTTPPPSKVGCVNMHAHILVVWSIAHAGFPISLSDHVVRRLPSCQLMSPFTRADFYYTMKVLYPLQ